MNYIVNASQLRIISANSVSGFCIIKQLGILQLLTGWDAKASNPNPLPTVSDYLDFHK